MLVEGGGKAGHFVAKAFVQREKVVDLGVKGRLRSIVKRRLRLVNAWWNGGK
jgi:hypothetical protein